MPRRIRNDWRMMQTILAWFLVAFILIAAYPWSAWLLRQGDQRRDGWLPLLLALALSTGALSLVMFWEGLLGITFTLWGITLPYLALIIPGWALWWRSGHPLPAFGFPTHWLARLAVGILLVICAGVLFNSVYWPFSRADAVGIYARFGARMAEQRRLMELPGALTIHEAYPILVPLTYTYSYLASGWINEFLARLFPALLSLGCLGAVYTLGTVLRGRLAGWISVMLLALTPAFGSWSSSGYVDLPMAFFYTLAAIFMWRLWQSPNWRDALLAGAMIGLAAWTKNAGLIGIPIFGVWLLWSLLRGRIRLAHTALALIACALVAVPWYLRNLVEANLIIPDTAWTDQAQWTLDTLFILITRPENYSLSGLLIVISLFAAFGEVIYRLKTPQLLLLLWWVLPFFAAWWLFASYDPRFILLFLPVMCVIAGLQLSKAWDVVPQNWQLRLRVPIAVVMIVIGAAVTWDVVEFKDSFLANPLASVEERRLTVFRERQRRLYNDLTSAP